MQHPPAPVNEQAIVDREHLRLLSLFFYVSGGVTALASSVLLIYLFLGLMMVATGGEASVGGLIFSGLFGLALLMGWTFAGLTIYTGRCIAQRKHKTFSMVMGGLNCLSFPYGTILGVCTIMVLMRDSVRLLYEQQAKQIGTAKPGMPVMPQLANMPFEPFHSNHDHHLSESEEEMWKEIEKRASEKKNSDSEATG